MKRAIPVLLLTLLSAAGLWAETVMIFAQSPGEDARKENRSIAKVTAYVENGISGVLFDNGHIGFVESVQEDNLTAQWDQARLIEIRGKTRAGYLIAVKILPEGEENSCQVFYQIMGAGGRFHRRGAMQVVPDSGSTLEEISLQAGRDIAGELLSRISGQEGKG